MEIYSLRGGSSSEFRGGSTCSDKLSVPTYNYPTAGEVGVGASVQAFSDSQRRRVCVLSAEMLEIAVCTGP